MAVHLKKRAYEEFGHVIQEPAKLQIKKLRLTKVSSSGISSTSNIVEDIKLNFDGQSSSQILQQLMEFSRKLPLPSECVQNFSNVLLKRFTVESDTTIRTKIAWLLGRLCLTINFNPLIIVDDMIKFIETEVSGKVSCQLWSAVLDAAVRMPFEKTLHQQLVALACSSLSDHHQEVRCQCLKVIGMLSTNKNVSQTVSEKRWDKVNVHTLVADYFADPEPRVRCCSLQALITMHQRGQRLEMTVYEQASSALLDDYEQVRMMAVELVWILSHIYPEHLIKAPYSDEKLPLIDDAFAKICNMFNDSSYKVRAEAARLLGSMHLVSDSFLFQTLDKKLMSDLKKKKSLNEQAKEGFVEEFSTGAKWADDAPREHNPDATPLMNSGACGAFVHGLEDEMMEVRSAAVDSLTELASQRSNSNFAQAALDFLVDCLNDEIEAVRLNAVNSLHKIVAHVTLLEDQLENVHAAMEDAGREIREGIHLLLSSCKLMSKQCLYSTIMMLLKNLNKYPQDRLSIWRTQKKLGEHHSNLVYLLVPQLLSCHPYFSSAEPEMDDPSYISVLILVFNATQSCPQMAQMFPEHVIRHYQYLRDSIPELVPQQLKVTTYTSSVDSCLRSPPLSSTSSLSDPATFLSKTMNRVSNLQNHDPAVQRTLLECTISDLRHIAVVAPSLSSTAQCSADFLQSQLLLSKAVDKNAWYASTHICSQHLAFAKPAATQIIQLTYELDHLYLGLSADEKGLIRQLRLKAQALLFVLEMQQITTSKSNKFQSDSEKSKANKLCKSFFKMVEAVHSFLTDKNITPDSFSQTLFNEFLKLSSSQKPSLVVKLLQPLLSHYSVSEVDLNTKVQRTRVIVHEPQTQFDAPLTFSAGLGASIHVDVTVENVVDPLSEVRIHVTYPDSTNKVFEILPQDIKKMSCFKYRIRSKVFVTHGQWTDSCLVKIAFVKVYESKSEDARMKDFYGSGLLHLCKPVEIMVHPKPASRV